MTPTYSAASLVLTHGFSSSATASTVVPPRYMPQQRGSGGSLARPERPRACELVPSQMPWSYTNGVGEALERDEALRRQRLTTQY